jgi:hypothetical protein
VPPVSKFARFAPPGADPACTTYDVGVPVVGASQDREIVPEVWETTTRLRGAAGHDGGGGQLAGAELEFAPEDRCEQAATTYVRSLDGSLMSPGPLTARTRTW